ncbi:BCCT family transporter [Streptomyces sp. FXY-T5]|uniref:BCCT family transporter n=2 Tax=unclassified Streptomyces TaxID=2593676 RepID=UPI00359C51C0
MREFQEMHGRHLAASWSCALTGLVVAVLLPAGGLEAVKQVAIIAAFPFLFVMIGLCVSRVKALRAEQVPASSAKLQAEREGVAGAAGAGGRTSVYGPPRSWRTRSPRAELPGRADRRIATRPEDAAGTGRG